MVKEVENIEDAKKRLEAYYNALIQHEKPIEETHTKKAIEYVVDSMDEDEMIELEKDILNKDNGYLDVISSISKEALSKRMMAYMYKFEELSSEQKELSAPMQEIVEKYKKFDFDSIVKEEINGNIFSYRKDKFPIENYRQKLEEIGNTNKGNQWSVSVSGDGRLVIY